MKGTIKFVDANTGLWGFILPDQGGPDVHFYVSEFVGPKPTPPDEGLPVEFDLEEHAGKRHARSPKLLEVPHPPDPRYVHPGDHLTRWAFVPFFPFRARNAREYSSVLELLADSTLDERWHFGREPNAHNPYPILDAYLKYTFYKLQKEGKIAEYKSPKEAWAIFNTGLVDHLYDPLYALFTANRRPEQPWAFYDFCVPGKGPSGKQLTAVFGALPEPAKYFTSNFDMLLDTSKDMFVDYEHVIIDGVRRDRFPQRFLSRHVPRGIEWQDYRALDFEPRQDFLGKLSATIEADVQCMRAIKNRLEDAKILAEKRTRWNFKTAIPQYYPRDDIMSLLLPLAIVDDQVVDVALVVTRNPSGSYQGRTVLPLSWAYKNARLVCRPDSDWLTPDMVRPEEATAEEEEYVEAEPTEDRTSGSS